MKSSAKKDKPLKIDKWKTFAALHLLLMTYSVGDILSKLAAEQEFMSVRFCLYYVGIIAILGIYAVGWQQIIKRMPLTTAFSNKAITVVWGIIWGVLFFRESITIGKIVGAILVIIGVVVFAFSDKEQGNAQ